MSDDLASLQPLSRQLTVAGQSVTVRAIALRHLREVQQALNGLLTAAQAAGDLTAADLVGLVAERADDLAVICARSSGLEQQMILDLPVDEVLPLVEAVIGVNVDFFLRQLPTRIVGLMTTLAGPPLSSDSLPTDTAIPTSSTTP